MKKHKLWIIDWLMDFIYIIGIIIFVPIMVLGIAIIDYFYITYQLLINKNIKNYQLKSCCWEGFLSKK